jgi:hypothetical protein
MSSGDDDNDYGGNDDDYVPGESVFSGNESLMYKILERTAC